MGKNLSILVGGGDEKRHDGYVKSFKHRMTMNDDGSTPHKVLGRQRMLHASRANGDQFPCIVGLKMVSKNTKVAGYIRDMSSVEKRRISSRISDVNASSVGGGGGDTDVILERVVEDHALDAIIATDDRGMIQHVNEATLAEFGYANKNDVLGEHISILIPNFNTQEQLTTTDEGGGVTTQSIVRLMRKDNGQEFDSIVATRKIRGLSSNSMMFATYIRNIEPVKAQINIAN